MVYASAERKVSGKHILLMQLAYFACLQRKPMWEKNAFHMTCVQDVSSISRLEPMVCVYPELSDAVAYRQSKQAVMSALD